MTAVRSVRLEHFRGFDTLAINLRRHALLTGEPGSGRSDLAEGLIRVLDPMYLRTHHPEDVDFHLLDTASPASVEVVVGDLSDELQIALTDHLEIWDFADEALVNELPLGEQPDPERHESVLRLGYRLSTGDDGLLDEIVYWPKHARPEEDFFPRASASDRSLVPFFWQRGLSVRPLDLAQRGEMRSLIDAQAGEDFADAVDRFMAGVEESAAAFSEQERVAAALDLILNPLREVRRFDPNAPGSELIRFLPDGGAPSGLLRSLSAAFTLDGTPEHLPGWRQGSSAIAALRGGLLHASATSRAQAIVLVDDFGGDIDPFLAAHIAVKLRNAAGQLIIATRSPHVATSFAPEEVVRLFSEGGTRRAARSSRPATSAERAARRWFLPALVPALSASSVVIVEGPHDRLALTALAHRGYGLGVLPSLHGAGITILEADGNGRVAKLSSAATDLGLFTIAVIDNDGVLAADSDPTVTAARAAAAVTIRLPPRTAIERLLMSNVPDEQLVRAFTELSTAIQLNLPTGWTGLTGDSLRSVLTPFFKQAGSLHVAFVEVLEDDSLCPDALELLRLIHRVTVTPPNTDLIEL